MIFSTLAAMADYNDDVKFNQSPNAAYDKTTMEAKNTAGALTLTTETLTIGNRTIVVSDSDKFSVFVDGLINRTPFSVVEPNMR